MPKELHDNVSRVKAPSPIGKGIFVGLRIADVFWQYNLISQGWGVNLIQKLGGTAIQYPPALSPLTLGQLQPYYGLVSLLSLGSTIKQVVHITFVSEQQLDPGSGILIAVFNTVFNSLNTVLSLWALSSPAASLPQPTTLRELVSSPLIATGIAAYAIGLTAEAVSEFQRKSFKKDPANKGKPYGGGLFSLATNINYGAYTLWRAGYALTCGGILWGATTFGFFFYDFASRGVPVMDRYLTKNYGDKYLEIKNRVKYSLLPGIY
ncbi:hypothetical protein BDV25DRAFT_147255 [Aspergillus avenaceus]|uniref:Steroid 5-alpha reductase C-terminal domain-containing protein n=1 Tax=Aspergillus avenaceus TaxID=36643 RepID=A0A5N6U7X6_ASPAV|nr:hypothetical protein BDV25DRAFT_147255 [Aspergillus avenaceus]